MEHRKLTASERYQERAYDKALHADLERANRNWQSAYFLFSDALNAQIKAIELDQLSGQARMSAMLLHASWLALETGEQRYAYRLATEGIRGAPTPHIAEELFKVVNHTANLLHGEPPVLENEIRYPTQYNKWKHVHIIWDSYESLRLQSKIENHKKANSAQTP